MNIYDYCTAGGKNVILSYIDDLPAKERLEIYDIRDQIREYGSDAFQKLNTRQLYGKMWEIKVSQTRIMYVIADRENVYFLHVCKKEKNKAEKQELDKAISRAKKEQLL